MTAIHIALRIDYTATAGCGSGCPSYLPGQAARMVRSIIECLLETDGHGGGSERALEGIVS
jgi:hypothetical protein